MSKQKHADRLDRVEQGLATVCELLLYGRIENGSITLAELLKQIRQDNSESV